MATGFPYARSLVAVECERTAKKTGEVQRDTRYFISSLYSDELTPSIPESVFCPPGFGIKAKLV